MSRIARISLTFVGILLVLLLIVAAISTSMVRRPFPQTNGTITAPGLQEEVNVYRDDYGIPHIYANNEHDLFFAQGYIHAQDRFWQMEFWRHVGQGRISEIAGGATINSDKFIRTFGWNRISEDIVEYYRTEAPEFYAILEAYSAGVNAYIAENEGELALQITILGLVKEPWEIEPWTPVNTVSWGVVMSDNLASSWGEELTRLQRQQTMDATVAAELNPGYPYDDRPVILTKDELAQELGSALSTCPENNTLSGLPTTTLPLCKISPQINWQAISTQLIGSPPPDYMGFGNGPFVGSNNWVISGQYTASGLPLLANDPHLAVQMPSIWYEVGLHAPGYDVVGFSFAGVPGVIVGHNDRIAWGVTTSAPDVQDLYIEHLNPDNPNQYEYMGGWHDMEVIDEVIKVNGGDDVVLPVRMTHQGPIVTEQIVNPESGINDVLSVHWATEEPPRILQSVVLLNQAQNYDDFFEAMRYWDMPSQSVVYADVDGNIAYQMPGRIPIRKNGDGAMPVPGWTDEYEWVGWIPHEELPAVVNPAKGYIATANNAVVDDNYPYFIGYNTSNGDRAERIVDMIEAKIAAGDKFTVDDFAQMQFDSKSLTAEAYAPLIAQIHSDDPQMQQALDYLTNWDFQERRDSVAAALWELTRSYLQDNVLVDELGQDNSHRIEWDVIQYDLAANPESDWWDDQTTPQHETAVDILARSLQQGITWFTENKGGDMADWTWGSIHTVTLADSILGQSGISLIENIFNRGPFPVDGGGNIVNANAWHSNNPAVVYWHPSMRMIVDLSDLENSRAVQPTGQSGHAFNPHYDDMTTLWVNGRYHSMLFGQAAVEAAAVDHLTLEP